jgi:hypothetical protein
MKSFFVVLAGLASFCCSAQRTVDVDKTDGLPSNTFFSAGGEPFVNVKFVRLTEGTLYFKNDWISGTGIAANGDRYKSAHLKLDLYDNKIHYLDASGTELIATSLLKEIILTDSLAGKTYHFVHASLVPLLPHSQGWYLQLASGKASLYQYFVKHASEWQPYGAATKEQRITTTEEFYLVKSGTVQQVKKPKDLPALLPDKQKELEAWLQKTNNKGKSIAEQLTALIDYYNTIQ